MEHQKVIQRGKITYYVGDTSVLVNLGGSQYVSYNPYNSPNKSGLSEFRKKILASKENQYDNVVDQIDLAQKCKVIGASTRRPEWLK